MSNHLRVLIPILVAATPALADGVRPERPTFCAGYTPEPSRHRTIKPVAEPSDALINDVALYACDAPDDAARQQQVAEFRASLVAAWGVSPAMTMSSLGARRDLDAYNSEIEAFCKATSYARDATDRENAINSAWHRDANCEEKTSVDWVMDEQLEAPQVWRLAKVMACYTPISLTAFDKGGSFTDSLRTALELTQYATCSVDINALDRGKIVAELAADKRVTPRVKVNILETFDQMKALTGKITAAYRAAAESSPEIKQVAFDAPTAAVTTWTTQAEAVKADLDLVIDIERRAFSSKKALKGCSATLRPAFLRLVAARHVTSKKELEALGNDWYGTRLMRAVAFCEELDGSHVAASCLSVGSSAARGPRSEALTASLRALAEIHEDKPRFASDGNTFWILGGGLGKDVLDAHIDGLEGGCEIDHAPMVAIKITGETANITFKTETWKRPTYTCVKTNRIARIEDNGTVRYEENCTPTGSEQVSSTPEPITVPAVYAHDLAPGQMLTFGRSTRGTAGMPLFSYKDKAQTKLVTVLGTKP